MPSDLVTKIRAKYPTEYQDMDDASLEKAVLAKHPEYADLAQPKASGPNWSVAPTLGGMVGGAGGFLLGGPIGAIVGAGLGGGMGEAARQTFGGPQNKPSTVNDALSGMVGQGVGQAVLEAVPQAAGRLLTKAAPHVMDMGLKRTAADRLQFPNTPQRLVDEGIIPRGQNVQKALSATEGRVNAGASAFDAAHPVGAVDPDKIANSAMSSAYQTGKVGGLGNAPGPEFDELQKLKGEYQAQNTRSRGLGETIDQKRAYQARAKYSARPNAPTVTNNALNFNGGVAAANRAEAIRLHPPLEADLSKEQDLIGALTAQENAAAKATPLSTIGTLKTVAGLRNPTLMGGAAIAADRAGQALKTPWTAAGLRAAIMAAMSGQ